MPQVGLRLRALHSQYSPTWHSKMPHQQQIAGCPVTNPHGKYSNPETRLGPSLAIRRIDSQQVKKVGGVGLQSKLREFSSPSPSPASKAVIRPWLRSSRSLGSVCAVAAGPARWPGLRDPLQRGPVCLEVLAPWPRNGEPTMEARLAIHRSPIHGGWRGRYRDPFHFPWSPHCPLVDMAAAVLISERKSMPNLCRSGWHHGKAASLLFG